MPPHQERRTVLVVP